MEEQQIPSEDPHERDARSLSFLFDSYNKIPCNLSSKLVLRESFAKRIKNPNFAQAPKNNLRYYCKYCYYPWREGNYSIKVLPKKVPGKRMLKLLRKRESSPEKITKFQMNLIKFVEQNNGNQLVLTCSLCNKKTVKPMYKDDNLIKFSVRERHENQKKKKKKDIFAGLNKQAVLKSASIKGEDPNTFQSNLRNKRGESYHQTEDKTESRLSSKLLAVNKRENYSTEVSEKKLQKDNIVGSKMKTFESAQNSGNRKLGFFHKQEVKMRTEDQKKKKDAVKNEQLRQKLKKEMKKGSKSKFTDFKNFLRDFGKPI